MDEIKDAATELPEKVKRPVGRPPKKPEEKAFSKKQKRALLKLNNGKGDIERLLFQQIKAFEWMQEAWITGMTRGAAGDQKFLAREDAEQGLKLATVLKSLVDTHASYVKQQKELKGLLTPDELLDKAVERIMSLDTKPRRELLRKLIDMHHAKTKPNSEMGKLRAPAVQEFVKEEKAATDAIADLIKKMEPDV